MFGTSPDRLEQLLGMELTSVYGNYQVRGAESNRNWEFYSSLGSMVVLLLFKFYALVHNHKNEQKIMKWNYHLIRGTTYVVT